MENFKCAGNLIKWNHENEIDKYQSVNSFKAKRRSKEECYELLSFYSDLDIYNSKFIKRHMKKINKYISRNLEIENITEETISHEHVEHFNDYMNLFNNYMIKIIVNKSIKIGLGKPSKINFSGRGYHVYWDIKARKIIDTQYYGVHGQLMQNQYNKLQRIIQKEFKFFGSDSKATDISRVLRVPGSINSKTYLECETIYETENSQKLSYYADRLYKYNYKQYKKYIRKTSKIQQEYIKKLVAVFEIDTAVLKNEFNLLVTEKYNDIDYVTTLEGTKIISKIRTEYLHKSINCKTYINTLLTNCLARNHVKEGNRSIFFYYLGIGYKRQEHSLNDALASALEINKKVNFNDTEVENAIKAAYKIENVNISKRKILSDLGIPNSDRENCLKGKRIRTTKLKKNIVKIILFKSYDKYINKSVRALSCEFKISKSTIQKLKKEIEATLFHKNQILKVIKSKNDRYREFSNYLVNYYKKLIDKERLINDRL